MTSAATQVHLVQRPRERPTTADLALVRVPLPPVGPGEVLVENRFLSVDPYMRGRMRDAPSYFPPWPLHAALDGDAVGVVVASRAAELPAGTWVASEEGLRDRFVAPAGALRPLAPPPPGHTHAAYLGALGATGFTASLGVEILDPQPGETVFVTTAAGAVGSVAAQLCKLAGARVIGSTSSPAKAEHAVRAYGFDAVFDYRAEPAAEALARLAPEGIDGLFDNVGGEQLEAALDAMRVGGRIAKCGAITAYNAAERPPGPRNLDHFFGKRLLMRGFLVSDHRDRRPAFEERMWPLLARGAVRADAHVEHGIARTPTAFVELFEGRNVGKTIVELDG